MISSFQTKPRNPIFALIALLIFITSTGLSPAALPHFQFNNDAFARRIQEQLLQNVSKLPLQKTWSETAGIKPLYTRFKTMGGGAFLWTTCGGGFPSRFNFEQRLTKLPDDPTLVLAAGYLQCHRIDISILEPRVPVALYPADYFDDYVYENILIADRLQFSEENLLRQIFLLVVESAAPPDDTWPFWIDAPQTDAKVSDFRTATGFVPELLLEFVGKTEVRIEMDFANQQVLVQTEDRWENYALDPLSGAALKEIAILERAKLRRVRSE